MLHQATNNNGVNWPSISQEPSPHQPSHCRQQWQPQQPRTRANAFTMNARTAPHRTVNAPGNTNPILHHRSTTIDEHKRESEHVKQRRETTTLLVQCPSPNQICNRNVNCREGFASTLLHRLLGSHISTSSDNWQSRI